MDATEYSRVVGRTEDFARPLCLQYGADPDLWTHVQLVRRYALALAECEGADREVVELAALLHDIGKCQGRQDHHRRSYDLSAEFLQKQAIPAHLRDLILECVLRHGSADASSANAMEVRVVQCADVLATLFDDAWQDHTRESLPHEEVRHLYERADAKITLASAMEIAAPRLALLRRLLDEAPPCQE